MSLLDSFYDAHEEPVNRACHGLAALCFFGAAGCLLRGRPGRALRWTLTGTALIAAGHALEGRPPAIVDYWRRKPRKVPRKPRRRAKPSS